LNTEIVHHLLAFRPYKRLILMIGLQEIEIERPEDARVVSVDGTADFYDLRLVERIKINDDFGFDELKRMLKE
jgi:hypothetical protein